MTAKTFSNSSRRTVLAVLSFIGLMALVASPAMAIPPPPTVSIDDGGDGYINASEQTAVEISGTYMPTNGSVVYVRTTISIDSGPGCPVVGTVGVHFLPPENVFVDGTSGTWSHIFDVSTLPEGPLCGRAVANDGTDSLIGATLTPTIKDTLGPAAGTATIHDGDGFVNYGESLSGVPASWTGVGDAASAELRFEDNTATIPAPPCGPHTVAATNNASQFPAACAAHMPDGLVTMRVKWFDAAGNPSPDATDTTILVTAGPSGGIVTITDPNSDGWANASEVSGNQIVANWINGAATVADVKFRDSNLLVHSPNCGPFVGEPPTSSMALTNPCATLMSDGEFAFMVRWRDAADNVAEGFATLKLDIKLNLDITSPGPGDTVPSTFTLTGTTDPNTTLSIQLDAGVPNVFNTGGSTSFSQTFTGIADGLHSIVVNASDQAGNTASDSVTFTVDGLIPIISTPVADAIVPRVFDIYGTCRPDTGVEIVASDGRMVLSTRCSSYGAFAGDVAWQPGELVMRARGVQGTTVSPFGPPRRIFVDPGPPSLVISTPDLAINPLQITGTANDIVGVKRIEIEYFDELRGVKLARGVVDCFTCGFGSGEVQWVHDVPTQLAPDLVRVEVTAVNMSGQESTTKAIKFLYVHDL